MYEVYTYMITNYKLQNDYESILGRVEYLLRVCYNHKLYIYSSEFLTQIYALPWIRTIT
jgi:hypothetical protein